MCAQMHRGGAIHCDRQNRIRPAQIQWLEAALAARLTSACEPYLFCWHPATTECFFAEAKGPRNKLRKPQQHWFHVYRATLPAMRILTCYLLPEKTAARQT